MLRIENVSKSYGAQILLDKVSLQVHQKERIGLVGRNGSGKTTLFKMVLGDETPDEGSIILPRGYRIGHVAQHLNFTKKTILEEGCLGLLPEEIDDHYKVEKILFGLGFTKEDLAKDPNVFSGGFQVRLNLAKVLVSNPNLLLLDEPTNYLDIISIRWIIKFLRNWKHELMIISHDREFMDKITTHTAIIHRSEIRKLKGSTAKLYEQIEQDETIYDKTRLNEGKKRKQLERFVERFGAKASKASAAKSKMKTIEKLSQKEALTKISNLGFKFQYKKIEGKQLIKVEDLQFGYDAKCPLIKNLKMMVHPTDRIAVVGKNGKGKSTLIKLLANELTPQKGIVQKHDLVTNGYFAQTNIDKLYADYTVEEEVQSANANLDRTGVRSICGNMMFSGDLAEKKISVLSGGERSRVMLGKIIATPTNVLLLDEPTNHLDMQSIDALVIALKKYQGALVLVTHNEMLLRSVANKLIVFQNNEVSIFDGTYDEFLEKIGWCEEEEKTKPKVKSHSKKKLRQQRADILKKQNQVLKPLKKKMQSLEKRIIELEEKEAHIKEQLVLASQEQNVDEIRSLSQEAKQVMDEINACFEQFKKADDKYEKCSRRL